jgi:pimeloyl-ACP methyl ester carboxylesterase
MAFIAATALAAASASRAGAADAGGGESEYDLVTATGTLFGTLLLPQGTTGKVPVVLIVAGSGPTDRDGNNGGLHLDIYKKLALALAGRGVATVRYDKRGIAASQAAAPAETALRFDDYVDDAAAWIRKLRADGRFSRVSLAGHSEGSLVGMVAVQRARVESYVSIEGAGFPADVVLRKQLAAHLGSQPDLLAQSNHILDELVQGNQVSETPRELAALFRPSVQPYLISWFKYDPRVEIAKVTSLVTVIQGTNDLQVSMDDGKALAAANPHATFVVLDGMTHVLSDDTGKTLAEQMTGAYADAERPLDPRLIDALIAAVRS